MFPPSYFAPSHFAPSYFPPAAAIEAPERVVRGGYSPRTPKRQWPDLPDELSIDRLDMQDLEDIRDILELMRLWQKH